jgi:amino acid transporter
VFAGTGFVVLLPAIAPKHMSGSWVFTTFSPDKAYTGINSNGMLFLLSLLGSQWAMVGYDAAAHMAEETQGADVSGACRWLARC